EDACALQNFAKQSWAPAIFARSALGVRCVVASLFNKEETNANPRQVRSHQSDCERLEKTGSILLRCVWMPTQRSRTRFVGQLARQRERGPKGASSRRSSTLARLW